MIEPVTFEGQAVGTGLHLYGIVRARGWRGRRRTDDLDGNNVRYRDIAAFVRPAPFAEPATDDVAIRAHQREVERIMHRTTILPAPYGIIFRDREAVAAFLEDQYLSLDEGLNYVDGHWEVRLHIGPAKGEVEAGMGDRAAAVYAELRRDARAAVPFPREMDRLLSAAFLVPRSSWIDFIERAESLGAARPELSVDVTGPWPPYDFVRIKL